MPFSLTWLPEVLEAAGLKVAEQPGWRTRGHGDMGNVRGVMCHHTAGPKNGNMPSLGICTNGRSNLPGPLSQLCLGRDGTWFVVAAGRASHAGPGAWQGITTGNSSFIGVEAENTGLANDHPWPDVQIDSYRRGVAAMLKRIGALPIMAVGHLEYALKVGRKSDPSFSVGNREQRIAEMKKFRDDVAAIMGGTVAPPPPIPASDANNRPTLRRGARGDLVKEVQKKVGVPPADVDGVFGPGTEAAVRQFQRRQWHGPGRHRRAEDLGGLRLAHTEGGLSSHSETCPRVPLRRSRLRIAPRTCVHLMRADLRRRCLVHPAAPFDPATQVAAGKRRVAPAEIDEAEGHVFLIDGQDIGRLTGRRDLKASVAVGHAKVAAEASSRQW